MAVYFVFQNTLGIAMTLALQVAIVLALLGLAFWLKKQFAPPDK